MIDLPILELSPDKYLGETIQYEIQGKLLTLSTRYNPYHDFYTIDVQCNSQYILTGHKLVTGVDLLDYYRDVNGIDGTVPNIKLIPTMFNREHEVIGIEDYGTNSAIVVIEEG
ncbi:MAG: phage baseplate plug family protein [Cellulosilyticaceae bacterium]